MIRLRQFFFTNYKNIHSHICNLKVSGRWTRFLGVFMCGIVVRAPDVWISSDWWPHRRSHIVRGLTVNKAIVIDNSGQLINFMFVILMMMMWRCWTTHNIGQWNTAWCILPMFFGAKLFNKPSESESDRHRDYVGVWWWWWWWWHWWWWWWWWSHCGAPCFCPAHRVGGRPNPIAAVLTTGLFYLSSRLSKLNLSRDPQIW